MCIRPKDKLAVGRHERAEGVAFLLEVNGTDCPPSPSSPPLRVGMTTVQSCSISVLSLSDVLMKSSSLLALIKSHRITINLPSEVEYV